MKKITKREAELKKHLNTMAQEVRKLPPSVFDNDIVMRNITVLKKYGRRIERLVKKYNGIVYGSALFTDGRSLKSGMRRTDDLDVVFLRKSDMNAFHLDVIDLLGSGFCVYRGKWGYSIMNRKTREKLMDTHVSTSYQRNKALEHSPRYVRGGNAAIKTYKDGIKGDDPRVAAVKKYNAAAQQLIDKQTWRIEKDMYDSGIIGRTALKRAKKLLSSTKNPKQKQDLQKIISRYEKAMLSFSSDPEVVKIRKSAERKYVKSGVIKSRTFTDPQKMKAERKQSAEYGIGKPSSSRRPRSKTKRFELGEWSKMF